MRSHPSNVMKQGKQCNSATCAEKLNMFYLLKTVDVQCRRGAMCLSVIGLIVLWSVVAPDKPEHFTWLYIYDTFTTQTVALKQYHSISVTPQRNILDDMKTENKYISGSKLTGPAELSLHACTQPCASDWGSEIRFCVNRYLMSVGRMHFLNIWNKQ